MTKEELFKYWSATIDDLEKHYYFDDDEYELGNDLSCRTEIDKLSLTSDELSELNKLDERFKAALWSALRAAGLTNYYLSTGATMPQNKWWWHVKDSINP